MSLVIGHVYSFQERGSKNSLALHAALMNKRLLGSLEEDARPFRDVSEEPCGTHPLLKLLGKDCGSKDNRRIVAEHE